MFGKADVQRIAGTEKLNRETLVDRLSAQLRQLIVSESIKSGEAFPSERELCEAFGVGRTTVREALQGMVARSALERKGKELIVVDPLTLPAHEADLAALAARLSVKDVFEMRQLIESKVIESAAKNWSDGDLGGLAATLELMREPATDEAYHEAHNEFHREIARIGKNPVLAAIYEASFPYFFKLPAYWRLFGRKDDKPRGRINGWKGHVPVYEAIANRDHEEAVRLNNEMNERLERTIIQQLKHPSV